MSDALDPADVLDFLRVQFAQLNKRLDGLDAKVSEVVVRTGALELVLAELQSLNRQQATMVKRVRQIEDRSR